MKNIAANINLIILILLLVGDIILSWGSRGLIMA